MARLINTTYVEASNQLGVDITGTVGTVQAWFKPTAAQGQIICKAIGLTGGTQRFAWGLDISAGLYRFWIGNGLTAVSNATAVTPVLGRWSYLVGVRRVSGVQELWIDGKLVASNGSPQTFTTIVDAVRLGQAVDGDDPCNGTTYDAALWKASLMPDDILRLYQRQVRPGDVHPQQLLMWMPVDGGIGPEIDRSRYAAHGTLSATIPPPMPDESYPTPMPRFDVRDLLRLGGFLRIGIEGP